MMANTPLPTLFGRLTTLLSEHEHLGDTQTKLRAMCDLLESGRTDLPATLQPATLFANLRAELSRHFTAEEGDAHFGEMARERPVLLPRIVELKTDHVTMLEALSTLSRVAADESRWNELVVPTRMLFTALADHEALEASLVQQFLAPAANA